MKLEDVMPELLVCYDKEIVSLISSKYNIPAMDALKRFLNSKTYEMLEDVSLRMVDYAPLAIFDMWENEQVTGIPLTSAYMRD